MGESRRTPRTATTRRTRGRAVAALTAAALLLSSCSPGESGTEAPATPEQPANTQYFGYQVNQRLVTTNAGSIDGVANNAEVLAGRLYPSVYVPGPAGEMIPNTDLATAQALPGKQRQVVYTLNADASYSDGEPITCVDFLLAHTAGTMTSLFDSHLPMMQQIERIDCDAGDRQFTAVFAPGDGGRWRQVFGPGTVMPAHTIARKAGMSLAELSDALHARDAAALAEVARIWNEGFALDSFDPELQVSSGPYVLSEVGPQGEAVLTRNQNYYGDPAHQDTIVVWPESADSRELAELGALRIADVENAEPEFIDRDDASNPYTVESRVGDLTESLKISQTGVLGQPWAREAFAACVDQNWAAAVSSQLSGVEVPPVATQVVTHFDPMRRHVADISDTHLAIDHDKARALNGTTIRIGYNGPDERKAAMVDVIAASCGDAGITVEDAASDGTSVKDLGRITTGQWGEDVYSEGTIDAFLGAVDPMSEYGAVSARDSDVSEIREAETRAWEELNYIPLAAQPRSFVIDDRVGNVVAYTGLAGIGWNMDRWNVRNENGKTADGTAEPAEQG
ncbi:ABC transporter substrate-binding protein [Corynebacterium guangdongense]|uniref:Peptide/nickel transport system substrate-binding protein n=1 Tax=Corynebacterium guangdongense TaxID=1783348 RepID=A0ABU1ZYI7_9CORY|nr:ABC transporter substrate-binding protein [Corynebacterium guangdongense]MDR7329458.1 peptide/nickel transport system substrate-binding protein [Corynebacterium guangdongense]WJZ18023.1 Bacterial extracellular solute-binding protein, family 5 [Corynebacterium guangdongense]